ncbi:MAG: hypothetical protein JXA04_00865 [Gammaproteobacteria bacterium]|nr:hypothetical protein [Gammaproteobacteria bacterium]
MANNRILGASFAIGLLMSTPAEALDFGVDAHAGSMGLGVGAAMQLTRNINMRVGLNQWKYDVDIDDEDGLEYNAELDLDNQYAMIDFFPSRNGGFHVTAGMYFNDNNVTGTARVINSGESQIGNSDALAGTVATGKMTFDGEAGYLGVGWGNTFSRGLFHFGFDLGVVYQGSPKADLIVALPAGLAEICAVTPSTNGCISDEDITLEEQQLEDEVSDYDLHPLLQATFGFSF